MEAAELIINIFAAEACCAIETNQIAVEYPHIRIGRSVLFYCLRCTLMGGFFCINHGSLSVIMTSKAEDIPYSCLHKKGTMLTRWKSSTDSLAHSTYTQ